MFGCIRRQCVVEDSDDITIGHAYRGQWKARINKCRKLLNSEERSRSCRASSFTRMLVFRAASEPLQAALNTVNCVTQAGPSHGGPSEPDTNSFFDATFIGCSLMLTYAILRDEG